MLMLRARRSILATIAAGVVAAAAVASVASGGQSAAGYNTAQAPMVTYTTNPGSGAPAGSTADAIISVGDTIGGYTFESIPDGVSVLARGNGRADVYVNHETSTVPFPFNSPWGGSPPNEANQNDFTNSELSQLTFTGHKIEINKASMAIKGLENYQRFCSNFLATAMEGFKQPILFTNEEAQDWVFRSGTAWPGPTFIPPATAGAEQAGVVVAHDVKNGKTKTIYGMGRHNHENSVAVPGFDELVVLSGDDTFQTNAPESSQLYMYTAADEKELWADEGTLHAFVANGTDNNYFHLQAGETISGNFVPVPEHIAKGKDPVDGHELTRAVDFPSYPAPSGGPSVPPDGPQWILDQWGNVANNPSVEGNDVFDFLRLEDIAYDKRPGMSNVVYIADSGRATATGAGLANPMTTSTNGRIYKMVLDVNGDGVPTDAQISILVQGDDVGTRIDPASINEIHQPDNLETTPAGNLLVTEDPSSANQYPQPPGAGKTAARLWKVPLNNPEAGKMPLLAVDQALDENANPALGKIDRDETTTPANLGAWESSGIVDASAAFGSGAFFLTIQAHSYWVDKATGPDVLNAPNGQDYVFKKEGGQLILLKMPGI
jgi:Alkaline phosphatase PhoX